MTAPHIIDALADLDEPTTDPQPDVSVEEVPAARQIGQRIECWLEGRPDSFVVTVANREVIAYEKTAARHKEWPQPTEAQPKLGLHFQMTFCTYVAAKRAGYFTGTFEAWADELIDWEHVQDVVADPTR